MYSPDSTPQSIQCEAKIELSSKLQRADIGIVKEVIVSEDLRTGERGYGEDEWSRLGNIVAHGVQSTAYTFVSFALALPPFGGADS